jgi:hypothetical protein
MGAKPWSHFTPYQADINAALQSLKEQEFRTGRYGFSQWFNEVGSVMSALGIPGASSFTSAFGGVVNAVKPSADALIAKHGDVHSAMRAVLEESGESGTMSILDMLSVSDGPDTCAVCPLSEAELMALFQTVQPSSEIIENILLNEEEVEGLGTSDLFWDEIGRAEGRYIIAYEDGKPTEIFFAGFSAD